MARFYKGRLSEPNTKLLIGISNQPCSQESGRVIYWQGVTLAVNLACRPGARLGEGGLQLVQSSRI